MPSSSPKRKQQAREWYYRQKQKPRIDGVDVLPDRVIAANPSTTEEAEYQSLVKVICQQLREKRNHVGREHSQKGSNIREYRTDFRYRMGLLTEA